jgi:hypothetical protein
MPRNRLAELKEAEYKQAKAGKSEGYHDGQDESRGRASVVSEQSGLRRSYGASMMETAMGRGILLWLLGIPIPIILLIWLLGGLHG